MSLDSTGRAQFYKVYDQAYDEVKAPTFHALLTPQTDTTNYESVFLPASIKSMSEFLNDAHKKATSCYDENLSKFSPQIQNLIKKKSSATSLNQSLTEEIYTPKLFDKNDISWGGGPGSSPPIKAELFESYFQISKISSSEISSFAGAPHGRKSCCLKNCFMKIINTIINFFRALFFSCFIKENGRYFFGMLNYSGFEEPPQFSIPLFRHSRILHDGIEKHLRIKVKKLEALNWRYSDKILKFPDFSSHI
jgi:hypothetical protein